MRYLHPRRRVGYFPGPSVVGFWGMFEKDFGDPKTEPAPTVVPSSVGGSILPWKCPHCGRVDPRLACPVERKKFQDPRPGRQGHYWCPLCRGRIRLDLGGMSLEKALPKNATHAPARVDWGKGKVETVGEPPSLLRRILRPRTVGLDVLGAEAWTPPVGKDTVGIYRDIRR